MIAQNMRTPTELANNSHHQNAHRWSWNMFLNCAHPKWLFFVADRNWIIYQHQASMTERPIIRCFTRISNTVSLSRTHYPMHSQKVALNFKLHRLIMCMVCWVRSGPHLSHRNYPALWCTSCMHFRSQHNAGKYATFARVYCDTHDDYRMPMRFHQPRNNYIC